MITARVIWCVAVLFGMYALTIGGLVMWGPERYSESASYWIMPTVITITFALFGAFIRKLDSSSGQPTVAKS